jgi:hypothetical protein
VLLIVISVVGIRLENNPAGRGAVISLAFPAAVELPAEVRG